MTEDFNRALNELSAGNAVAIPTETVYGLAARIDKKSAIEKIFSIKERPFFDPLIVHVSSPEQAQKLVTFWTPLVSTLTQKFWPGPLTLVMNKTELVSDLITSGLPQVAVRMPRHTLSLKLINSLGVPLAAPSANKFGKTSPTTAEHVRQEFASENVLTLDGGPCEVGIESTVLQVSADNKIAILRKGFITEADIESALTRAHIAFTWQQGGPLPSAPGQMRHHYMPAKPLILCRKQAPPQQIAIWLKENIEKIPDTVDSVKIIKPPQFSRFTELKLSADPVIAARELYSQLRAAAQTSADFIYFYQQPIHSQGLWPSIMDRLTKASTLIFE